MNAASQPPVAGAAALDPLVDAALEASQADETEVLVIRESGGLTRFTDSQVHQSVTSDDWRVTVRAVTDDGRAGVVTVGGADPAGAATAAHRALALARLAPADPDFPGVAPPAPARKSDWDEATAAASPSQRADVVRAALSEVDRDLSAAGFYRTGVIEVTAATSAGQRLYAPLSSADMTMVITGSSSTGYAEAGGRAAADVDPRATARHAVAKTRAGADPTGVEAGEWPVVLEPTAVAAIVQFLGDLGFGAKVVAEERSFATGRFGEAVLDPKVSIVDDAHDPGQVALPFDFEGTPTERVDLVRDGVLNGVVHDRRSAHEAGTRSTGHALPPPNPLGPVPASAAVEPGSGGSIDDLVAGLERGLLVTRLHYVNVVHPRETILTGMTRDGTFLVEDGQIVRPVHNLRFTQSAHEALADVRAVSTTTAYGSELLFGGGRQPALALPSFKFTGTTSFG